MQPEEVTGENLVGIPVRSIVFTHAVRSSYN